MYALLFGMVGTLLSNLAGSITFVLGQELGINQKKYGKLQDSFELVYISLSFSLFFIAYTYILPFLKIYIAGITDINYIDRALSVLFVVIALLENSRLSSAKAIHVAGHFKQTQWHAWVEVAINIIVSLIGVLVWGIYGVLIGTIAALLFRANAMIIYANKNPAPQPVEDLSPLVGQSGAVHRGNSAVQTAVCPHCTGYLPPHYSVGGHHQRCCNTAVLCGGFDV